MDKENNITPGIDSPFLNSELLETATNGNLWNPQMETGESPYFYTVETDRQLDHWEEEIIAPDDTRVMIQNTSQVPYRWICCLNLFFINPDFGSSSNEKWIEARGTGTLIGPDLVLTAAHVLKLKLPDSNGDIRIIPISKIEVIPGRNDSTMPFGTVEASEWIHSSKWRTSGASFHNFDFALLRLESPIGLKTFDVLDHKPLGWWGSKDHGSGTIIKRINPKFLKDREISSAGYPGDKCGDQPDNGSASTAAMNLCASQTPDKIASTAWEGSGEIISIFSSTRIFLHTIDTMGGQSGSPVWIPFRNRRFLIGVHSSPGSPISNIAVRFTHEMICQLNKMRDHLGAPAFDWFPVKDDDFCNKFTYPITDASYTGSLEAITQIAADSDIARFRWRNRRVAPLGYIKGMALVFGRVYSKLKAGNAAALEMAKANTGLRNRDALAWYQEQFAAAGLSNDSDGVGTLRHLFVLLIGLGMRESSGKWCVGRDRSASNTSSVTAEAGLFQASFNLRGASPLLRPLFNQYLANPRSGFLETFKEGVTCRRFDLRNFGTGDGKKFQQLSKNCPAFAAEFVAIGLRNRRRHWGPINRRQAEIRVECDTMLREVQDTIDRLNLSPLLL